MYSGYCSSDVFDRRLFDYSCQRRLEAHGVFAQRSCPLAVHIMTWKVLIETGRHPTPTFPPRTCGSLCNRWFICIYAGSMASQAVVARIWDLFLWYGRRGPAVLVWVALGVLHGCRRRIFESTSLPTAVKAVRRHAEACKTFDDLVRQAPVGLNQVRK